jgi:hypothetical protein
VGWSTGTATGLAALVRALGNQRLRNVIKSRNADVEAVSVSAVEGKPLYDGDMLVKPLIKGDEMTFLEIHYAAGVGAPLHTHTNRLPTL